MSLTQSVNLLISEGWQDTMAALVASEITYVGSLLSRDPTTGCVHRLVGGEVFAGISNKKVEAKDWVNATPANGDVFASYVSGRGFITAAMTVTQIDAANKRAVYATDDGTFTFTPCGSAVGSNATYIGRVVDIKTTSIAIVEIATDDVLDDAPGVRGAQTIAAGATTLIASQANRVIRTQGASAQTITLPTLASWAGKTFVIINAVGGGLVTIAANAADSTSLDGGATIAQTRSTVGATTLLYSTGQEIAIISNR
jgi:hypothetical protein